MIDLFFVMFAFSPMFQNHSRFLMDVVLETLHINCRVLNDGKTIQLVPSSVNSKFGHLGGVSEVIRQDDTLKMKKDELFGEIVYEDLWIGTTEVTMFGENRKILLNIYGEENEEINSNQRDAFSQFKANMPSIVKESEDKILEYYLENYEDYRAMQSDSEEVEKIAPKISSIDELGRLVTPTGLLIRYDFEDGIRRVGILCDCTWEQEHGLGISVENEEVVKVGLQDIVL